MAETFDSSRNASSLENFLLAKVDGARLTLNSAGTREEGIRNGGKYLDQAIDLVLKDGSASRGSESVAAAIGQGLADYYFSSASTGYRQGKEGCEHAIQLLSRIYSSGSSLGEKALNAFLRESTNQYLANHPPSDLVSLTAEQLIKDLNGRIGGESSLTAGSQSRLSNLSTANADKMALLQLAVENIRPGVTQVYLDEQAGFKKLESFLERRMSDLRAARQDTAVSAQAILESSTLALEICKRYAEHDGSFADKAVELSKKVRDAKLDRYGVSFGAQIELDKSAIIANLLNGGSLPSSNVPNAPRDRFEKAEELLKGAEARASQRGDSTVIDNLKAFRSTLSPGLATAIAREWTKPQIGHDKYIVFMGTSLAYGCVVGGGVQGCGAGALVGLLGTAIVSPIEMLANSALRAFRTARGPQLTAVSASDEVRNREQFAQYATLPLNALGGGSGRMAGRSGQVQYSGMPTAIPGGRSTPILPALNNPKLLAPGSKLLLPASSQPSTFSTGAPRPSGGTPSAPVRTHPWNTPRVTEPDIVPSSATSPFSLPGTPRVRTIVAERLLPSGKIEVLNSSNDTLPARQSGTREPVPQSPGNSLPSQPKETIVDARGLGRKPPTRNVVSPKAAPSQNVCSENLGRGTTVRAGNDCGSERSAEEGNQPAESTKKGLNRDEELNLATSLQDYRFRDVSPPALTPNNATYFQNASVGVQRDAAALQTVLSWNSVSKEPIPAEAFAAATSEFQGSYLQGLDKFRATIEAALPPQIDASNLTEVSKIVERLAADRTAALKQDQNSDVSKLLALQGKGFPAADVNHIAERPASAELVVALAAVLKNSSGQQISRSQFASMAAYVEGMLTLSELSPQVLRDPLNNKALLDGSLSALNRSLGINFCEDPATLLRLNANFLSQFEPAYLYIDRVAPYIYPSYTGGTLSDLARHLDSLQGQGVLPRVRGTNTLDYLRGISLISTLVEKANGDPKAISESDRAAADWFLRSDPALLTQPEIIKISLHGGFFQSPTRPKDIRPSEWEAYRSFIAGAHTTKLENDAVPERMLAFGYLRPLLFPAAVRYASGNSQFPIEELSRQSAGNSQAKHRYMETLTNDMKQVIATMRQEHDPRVRAFGPVTHFPNAASMSRSSDLPAPPNRRDWFTPGEDVTQAIMRSIYYKLRMTFSDDLKSLTVDRTKMENSGARPGELNWLAYDLKVQFRNIEQPPIVTETGIEQRPGYVKHSVQDEVPGIEIDDILNVARKYIASKHRYPKDLEILEADVSALVAKARGKK